ncbi:MAG: hypothetical protein ACOCP4_02585 [Candidatus Woesearchaeota archaeon]
MDQTTTSSNGSLEDFEDNSYNESYEEETKKEKKGLNSGEVALTVASMTAQFIPEEHRNKYIEQYVMTTQPILDLIGFEDLTAGADLSNLPPLARGILAVGGIAGPALAFIYMYNADGKPVKK